MEKQNTPIQQAIEKLKEKIKEQEMFYADSYVKGKIKAYKQALETLTDHLPKEQAAIEKAYKEGCMYYSEAFPKNHYNIDAEFYFTNKYKSNDTNR